MSAMSKGSYFRPYKPRFVSGFWFVVLAGFDLWAIGFFIWNCWQLWGK